MRKMNNVCLVVIARNEERSIERCLKSFSKHVDRMLVLDTGSSDNTIALAKSAGARIGAFKWCDNFSAARNAALKLAGADWHLVADADEWLQSGGEFLRGLCQGASDQMGKVLIHNEVDAPGHSGVVSARLPRLLPGHVRYRGSIHEQPDSLLPMVDIPLVFGHDGYCDEQRKKKSGRNEQLLRAAIVADPKNPYLLYQLGCERMACESHAEAADMLVLSLGVVSINAQYRYDLVHRLLSVFVIQQDWTAAIKLIEQEMPKYSTSPNFMLKVGDIFYQWAEQVPAQSSAAFPIAEDAWMQVLHLARTQGSDQWDQLEQPAERAALNLSVLCSRFCNTERAIQFATYANKLRLSAEAHRK